MYDASMSRFTVSVFPYAAKSIGVRSQLCVHDGATRRSCTDLERAAWTLSISWPRDRDRQLFTYQAVRELFTPANRHRPQKVSDRSRRCSASNRHRLWRSRSATRLVRTAQVPRTAAASPPAFASVRMIPGHTLLIPAGARSMARPQVRCPTAPAMAVASGAPFLGAMCKLAARQRDRPVRPDRTAAVFDDRERAPQKRTPNPSRAAARSRSRVAANIVPPQSPAVIARCSKAPGFSKNARYAGFVAQIDGTARRSRQALDGPINVCRMAGRDHSFRAQFLRERGNRKAPPMTITRFQSSDIAASVTIRLLEK
jgi:hypothetical protein